MKTFIIIAIAVWIASVILWRYLCNKPRISKREESTITFLFVFTIFYPFIVPVLVVLIAGVADYHIQGRSL